MLWRLSKGFDPKTGAMNPRKRKKFAAGALLIACIGLVLFYPFETTIVPAWKVRIIDESGKPVLTAPVSERWRHHSIETHGHNETSITDDEGYVSFPRRTVRASLVFRIVGGAVVRLNVHGESGPKASLLVLGPYSSLTKTTYNWGEPLPETIVVRRMD